MLLTILSILGTLVPTILQNRGVIGASTDNLITMLAGTGINLFASLKNGTTKTDDALAALAALSGAINVLRATTGLPADVLTYAENLDKDVQAALMGYALAGTGLDLTIYKPIAEVA